MREVEEAAEKRRYLAPQGFMIEVDAFGVVAVFDHF